MKTTISILLFTIIISLFSSCEREDPFSGDSGTFSDSRDGNEYNWVRIGEQIWMAENLKYMPYVCPADSQCGIWVLRFDGTKTGAALGTDNYRAYGCLYDWETAITSCPKGWHLPSDEEWIELEIYLGVNPDKIDDLAARGKENNVGGKLRETGTIFWEEPNLDATNESGFTARPGSLRIYRDDNSGGFGFPGSAGNFWASSPDGDWAWFRQIDSYSGVYRDYAKKKYGFSVRCIKD